MSKLGIWKVQVYHLLQNVKLQRPVQRDQQCFDRRQELHLWVFIGRSSRLLPHAKMLLVPTSFFLCWVDYALEGSTFSLSKCDFSRMFHTERSWHISIDCSYCFLVGRICPLMQAHFLWPLLKRKAFLLRLNKGSNFLQSAFWIWITKRFSLVRECNVFLKCCITLGPAR